MLRLALPLLLLAPLAACVHVSDANSDPTIGGAGVALQYLEDGRPAQFQAPSAHTPDGPSLTGLSRESWPEQDFLVPDHEVEHQQLYTSDWARRTHSTAVQRGEYPTPENVDVNVTGCSQRDQRIEALLMPVQAVTDAVMLIPRAIFTSPTTPDRSPSLRSQRTPQSPMPPAPSAPTPASTPAPALTPDPLPAN